MKYTEFVKAQYAKVKHLPAKERMKAIAKMWRESGHAKAKGAGLGSAIGSVADSIFGLGMEKKKPHKRVAGKGLGSAIGSIADEVFGLGLEKKKKAGRPRKHTAGKGLGSDLGALADNIFGLGMKKEKKMGKHHVNELLSDHLLKTLGQKPSKQNKMKVLQHLAQGGSFNDAWDGIKTGFTSVVNPATIGALAKFL